MPSLPQTPSITTPKKWQAVFFDFDGVLVDSVPIKTESFRALYDNQGKEIQDKVEAYHMQYGGVSRYEKIRYFEKELLGCSGDDKSVNKLADKFASLVKERVVAAAEMQGGEDFIKHLKSLDIPLYVVSGTPETELLEIVERRGLKPYFKIVRGAPPSKTKILPEMILELGYNAKDCLMIGDATTDYEAAIQAGTQFLGIIEEDKNPFPKDIKIFPNLASYSKTISI